MFRNGHLRVKADIGSSPTALEAPSFPYSCTVALQLLLRQDEANHE
jgi:hypothetical protein